MVGYFLKVDFKRNRYGPKYQFSVIFMYSRSLLLFRKHASHQISGFAASLSPFGWFLPKIKTQFACGQKKPRHTPIGILWLTGLVSGQWGNVLGQLFRFLGRRSQLPPTHPLSCNLVTLTKQFELLFCKLCWIFFNTDKHAACR